MSMELPETLSELWSLGWGQMEKGASSRKSGFHHAVVCTEGPDARVMILRGADRDKGLAWFHTDARAPKGSFLPGPVCLVFYDSSLGLQARCLGEGELLVEGPVVDEAWSRSRLFSRKCYLSRLAPGTETQQPDPGLPEALRHRDPTEEESEEGRENFAVLMVRVRRLDVLILHHEGHRRAIFESGRGWWAAP
jgi:hypothetical protein